MIIIYIEIQDFYLNGDLTWFLQGFDAGRELHRLSLFRILTRHIWNSTANNGLYLRYSIVSTGFFLSLLCMRGGRDTLGRL